MKPILLLLSFCFISTLASAQQWEVKWQGGTNYTFLKSLQNKEETSISYCSPTTGYCTIYSSESDLRHTFDSKWGGYGQLELTYKLNEKWNLQYAMGSQLQRYQRHVEFIFASLYPGGGESPWDDPNVAPPNSTADPELGNTRSWYLRHQLGASYNLYPKLALSLAGWADVLLQGAEYQMKSRYNSQTNGIEIYGEYDKSGAGFKHTVAGVQAGLSYTFLPRLNANLSYSRSLTPQYKKSEFASPGKAYTNQLQLGLGYSLFRL